MVFLAGVFGLDGGPELGVGLFDEDVAVVHGSRKKHWSPGGSGAAQANG